MNEFQIFKYHPTNVKGKKNLKLHRVDDKYFISIKYSEKITYKSEKLFPGDDRDILERFDKREFWAEVLSQEQLDIINSINEEPDPEITIYYSGEKNNYKIESISYLQKTKEEKRKELEEWERKIKEEQDFWNNIG